MSRERGNIEAMIAARYNKSATKKKNVSFNIDEELLERLDAVVSEFNGNDGDSTRNSVIEEAVIGYVESAEDYFSKQAVIHDREEGNTASYDTAIYPATNENFTKVFIGEKQWYYVRMAEFRIKNIKYIALYRGAPVSAITHYAEVLEIGEANQDNKRLIKLKEPKSLPKPIVLGNIHVNNVRKLFYTTLSELEHIESVEEILNK